MTPGKLKLTIAFCLCCYFIQAQHGKLLFHHLTLKDGLSEQTNSFVYKDSRGFVWISSTNGLNRFDGIRILQYTPDQSKSGSIYGENIQSNFFEGQDGLMWFCTHMAINAYDPKQDTFSHYILQKNNDSLSGYHVFHLDAAENLWLLVDGKEIYRFNIRTKQFTFVAPLKYEAQRATMVKSKSGEPAFIFTYAPSQPTLEVFSLDAQSKVSSNKILSEPESGQPLAPKKISNDGDSILWMAVKDRLVKYYLEENVFQFFPIKNLFTLEQLDSKTLLLSLSNEGLWEYDKSRDTLIRHYLHRGDEPQSPIANTFHWISKDRDGVIWASSDGVGISYSNPAKSKFNVQKQYSLTDQTPLRINGMLSDNDGNIFCSDRPNGLFTLNRDGKVIREWNFTDPRAQRRSQSIYKIFGDRNRNKWIASFNGLSVIPPDKNEMIHVSDDTTKYWSIFHLHNDKLFCFPARGGFYELIQQRESYIARSVDSMVNPKVYLPFHQDKNGLLWMSENLVRIILMDPLTLQFADTIPIEGFVQGIIENEKDHLIWLAGAHGLFKISTHDYKIKSVYNQKRILDCSGITNLRMDHRGQLWLTCSNQIIMFDPVTEKTRTFDETDGLPHHQINTSVSYQFEDGEIWFATNDAIIRFYPDDLDTLDIRAIPQITSLLVNNQSPKKPVVCQNTGATNITAIQKLIFSHRENTISFIINSLEYSAPENNLVKYMLEGVDPDWVIAPSGSLARYPDLRAGTFLFKVQAANSDGIYNDDIRQLTITITPPFYKTWWFITLSALALLGLILYIMYLIFSKKIELQKERLRLYENLHDEVGSRLTSIVFMAEEVAQQNDQNPKLQQITKVAKSIVANMRRLVWATDPENDTMQSLVQKIRLDKSMILDDKIDFHLDLDPKLSDMNLQGEIRYQITSVINEALNNISKYAEAKNVFILLGIKDNDLHLRIRDDGIGFNPEETKVDKVKSSGYGLGNMNKRIARVKGSLVITSQQGKGTTIDARIPLS